jgi:multimeric flavodoxin WrbA
MKAIGVNGSPRKKWNTATLLKKALEGAASEGAKTTLVHLYDLDYKGCISCFACKMRGGKSYGKCAVKDGLRSDGWGLSWKPYPTALYHFYKDKDYDMIIKESSKRRFI